MVPIVRGGAARVGRGVAQLDGQRRARLVDALCELATALLADPSDDGGLALVARGAREFSGARVAAVMVPNARAGTADVRAVAGREGSGLLGAHVPLPKPASVDGEAPAGIPPPVGTAAAGTYLDDLLPVPGVGAWLVVPLVAHGRQLAVLALGLPEETAPSGARDLAEVGEFAARAAEILDHAAARVRAQELALTEDEDRIAAALNDRVVPRMLWAGLRLHSAQSIATDPLVADRIEEAVAELDDAVREIRTTVFARVVGDAAAVGAASASRSSVIWEGSGGVRGTRAHCGS
jgi:hypothetical protein